MLTTQDQLVIHFFWGPRRESLEQCAESVFRFLRALKTMDPCFGSWENVPAYGRRVSQAISAKALESSLAKGVNRDDIKHEVIPDLGYSLNLYSNSKGCQFVASLSINCGVYTEWVKNSCVLCVLLKSELADRLSDVTTLSQICRLLVKSWTPDFGRVTTNALMDIVSDSKPPDAGWLTYVSGSYGPIPTMPAPARIESVDNLGSLIIATDERFSTDDKNHVNLVKKLSRRLDPLRKQ